MIARLRALTLTAAVLLWGGSLVVVVLVDRRLAALGRSDLHQLSGAGWVFLLGELSALTVGGLLLVRRPEHPVGWCLIGLGASISATGGLQSYGLLGLVADPSGPHPGAAVAALLASSLFVAYLVTIASVCFLTPTGRSLSPRWRRAHQVMVGTGAVWFLVLLVDPGPLQEPFGDVESPWALHRLQHLLHPLRFVSGGVNNVLVLASFGSLVVRYRRSRGDERRQLMWLGLAGVAVPVLVVAAFVSSRTGHPALLNLAAAGSVAVLPVAVGLAVARTRLYDVDRILSRAAAYVLLSALLTGTYVGLVVLVTGGAWGVAGSSRVGTAVATLAAAALARPAHRVIQDLLDRRFARRRYDALRLVRAHVDAPGPDGDVEQVLRDALRVPGLTVRYWVADRECWVRADGSPADDGEPFVAVARSGRPVARVSGVPLGDLLVSSVLDAAAPELESTALRAVVAVQLHEVRASRERLAAAQLDERRRIERDLHDGAQQRLLALAAHQQAALLNGDVARLRSALEQGVRESRAAVTELRDLAHGMYPLSLAAGGLAAALDELATRHDLEVEVQEPARRYPPGVEAAAWFIACEGVVNAVKHARATRTVVRVHCVDGHLHVRISDDGCGGADGTGRGLRGLADRAEAVGGRLHVVALVPSGTAVKAVLPCGS